MTHVIGAMLVLMVALAETTVLQQWSRQHELAGIQQAAVAATFQSRYQSRN